jgi:integrase
MANVSNKLVDSGIKTAQAKKTPYKLFDGEGMYLLVTSAGQKYWRLKYRFAGKEKVLAMGVYPDVGLAAARVKRTDARKLLTDNIDPGLAKKEQTRQERIRAGNTFEAMAREWHSQQKHKWTATHAERVLTSLEANIFPSLGRRPVAEITPAELLDILRIIEHRGALDMANRVLQRCSATFRYAIASQRTRTNPASDLKGALKAPKRKHYSALSAKDLPEFLIKLEQFDGYETTKLAIHLLMLTFVCTGELRSARWDEFDIPGKLWRIPADRMKMGIEHLVPLSDQTIQILERLQYLTGAYDLVFPGRSKADKPMSENTVLYGLYRMGYHSRATGHGFRTTASTVLNELGFDSDAIERQLAHGEKDKVRAAYNRAKYLDKRKVMMQAWADYLDGKKDSDNVVPIRSKQL